MTGVHPCPREGAVHAGGVRGVCACLHDMTICHVLWVSRFGCMGLAVTSRSLVLSTCAKQVWCAELLCTHPHHPHLTNSFSIRPPTAIHQPLTSPITQQSPSIIPNTHSTIPNTNNQTPTISTNKIIVECVAVSQVVSILRYLM